MADSTAIQQQTLRHHVGCHGFEEAYCQLLEARVPWVQNRSKPYLSKGDMVGNFAIKNEPQWNHIEFMGYGWDQSRTSMDLVHSMFDAMTSGRSAC